MGCVGLEVLFDVVGTCSTEDDDVEQRVGTQSVGTVYRDTGSFTGGVQSWNDLILSVLVDSQDLSGVLGGDTSHATTVSKDSTDCVELTHL